MQNIEDLKSHKLGVIKMIIGNFIKFLFEIKNKLPVKTFLILSCVTFYFFKHANDDSNAIARSNELIKNYQPSVDNFGEYLHLLGTAQISLAADYCKIYKSMTKKVYGKNFDCYVLDDMEDLTKKIEERLKIEK